MPVAVCLLLVADAGWGLPVPIVKNNMAFGDAPSTPVMNPEKIEPFPHIAGPRVNRADDTDAEF